MQDLRQTVERTPDYPAVLFFYQGSIAEGTAFFERLWPEARAVSDTPKYFYNALGLKRGGMRQMFGPDVIACGVRAGAKGHTVGAPVGDPWQMPGLFLVKGDSILWQHDFSHAGDHPDWAKIPGWIR